MCLPLANSHPHFPEAVTVCSSCLFRQRASLTFHWQSDVADKVGPSEKEGREGLKNTSTKCRNEVKWLLSQKDKVPFNDYLPTVFSLTPLKTKQYKGST